MKVQNEVVEPGMKLDTHCIEYNRFKSTVRACYAEGVAYLPNGNMDDLLYTELDFKWKNGWHKHEYCFADCDPEFVQNQINHLENGDEWIVIEQDVQFAKLKMRHKFWIVDMDLDVDVQVNSYSFQTRFTLYFV